jgi:DNA polymerase III sliding clamp (beta) subunit (PCNA family)
MLKTLKFVAGAIAKKDFVPYMTHFSIKEGRVTSYNGLIALSSPISIDLDCKPKADVLVKAISNCEDTIILTLTDTGRLKVQSGKFKAFIECLVEPTPEIKPEGQPIEFNGEGFINALGKLYSFIGEDASRPWANGVLLSNGCAYATNNVCVIQHWLGFKPKNPINIPKQAIREILRIGDTPTYASIDENSITLHYGSGRWIKSQLLATSWPDIEKILDKASEPKEIDSEIFKGLDTIKPFVDKLGSVFITPGIISTTSDLEDGTHFSVESIDFEGLYNIDMIKLLEPITTFIDWTQSPVLFFGDELRGAMMGMRRRRR